MKTEENDERFKKGNLKTKQIIQVESNQTLQTLPFVITNTTPRNRALTYSEKIELINSSSSQMIKFLKSYLSKIKEVDSTESLDHMIYGIKTKRIFNNLDLHDSMIYISDNLLTDLVIVTSNKNFIQRFAAKAVSEISFGNDRGNFIKSKKKGSLKNIEENVCLSLHFLKADSIDLIFYSTVTLEYFLRSILYLLEKDEESKLETNNAHHIKKLWNIYDRDHSDKMELQEFTQFFRKMNFGGDQSKGADNNIEAYFNQIDVDNSGKIDYQEFLNFYKDFTSGKEFEHIFREYTKGTKGDYMTKEDFVLFMNNEQKELNFGLEDAEKIINNFSTSCKGGENINESKYGLNLEEFRNFLINKTHCSIYDLEAFNNEQDMTRPLNEYFIFSSHNTYLTKHQLYGESSVEMYNFAVVNGCRLVELDCWDGPEEPIITHGHTFTSNISFRDVLINMRQNSFKTSPYPVLFSIEMHCSPEQQIKMARLFKEILKDIYVIDEHNPPERYPSPEELKGKFIIKEGRSKIDRPVKESQVHLSHKSITSLPHNPQVEKMDNLMTGYIDTKVEEGNIEEENSDIDKSHEEIPDENNVISCYFTNPTTAYHINLPNRENNSGKKFIENIIKEQESENSQVTSINEESKKIKISQKVKFVEKESKIKEEDEINQNTIKTTFDLKIPSLRNKKTTLSEINEMSHDYDLSSRIMEKSEVPIKKKNHPSSNYIENILRESKTSPNIHLNTNESINKMTSYQNTDIDRMNTLSNNTNPNNKKKKEKKEEKTVEEIQNLVGLCKIKFDMKKLDYPDSYQPWDCPSIKESKIEEIVKDFEKRKKFVNYCKNSFIKIYPMGTRFDSSNFDPVKSWICGAQIAAMNLQSLEEDSMLINTVFFKINGNCGYILKPDFLRSLNSEYSRNYKSFRMKLSLQFISAQMLHNCVKNKIIGDFYLSCYIVGSWEDDSFNTKFQSKKYKKNLLNSLFEEENYSFDIYEPEISFIIIKLFSDGNVFARGCIPVSLIKEGVRVLPLYDDMCKEIVDAELVVRAKKCLEENIK